MDPWRRGGRGGEDGEGMEWGGECEVAKDGVWVPWQREWVSVVGERRQESGVGRD